MHRSEYMDPERTSDAQAEALHRAYYGQYVTDAVKAVVLRTFTVEQLRAALPLDKHLNNLPLRKWDAMVPRLPATVPALLKQNGDWLSLSTGVCTLKEAARQIVAG